MYDPGWGFGFAPNYLPVNKIIGVFTEIVKQNGTFLFNLSGVDVNRAKKGFVNFEEAVINNQITEWELSMILIHKEYFKRCIFHNGKVQFKKQLIWKAIMSK